MARSPDPGSSETRAKPIGHQSWGGGPAAGNRRENVELRFRRIFLYFDSLTRLCLIGFSVSNLKGWAMELAPAGSPNCRPGGAGQGRGGSLVRVALG